MKVLLLSRYGRMGSSSRLRFFQYIPLMEPEHIQVTTSPFLNDEYLIRLYAGKGGVRLWWLVLSAYGRRITRLLKRSNYDLIWIEKEIFPWLPVWCEKLFIGNLPCIVDYDDAVFHNYDRHASAFVRWLLGNKIDKVMRNATLVTAGNSYLADRAKQAGATWVEYLPTVIDLERYAAPENRAVAEKDGRTVIGWIGSPSTVKYLEQVAPALEQVCLDSGARIIVVGAKTGSLSNIPAEFRNWSEDSEVAEICRFDIGIMPLPDDPWARGKCGYKLIQYMACGKAVMASPVGVNSEIVTHGHNGFLTTTEDEWEKYLRLLIGDRKLRQKMGKAGRQLVVEKYCVQHTAPQLIEWMGISARRKRC
jgi:glycosyltransferase involved in cell wall biosynthesis